MEEEVAGCKELEENQSVNKITVLFVGDFTPECCIYIISTPLSHLLTPVLSTSAQIHNYFKLNN